MALSAIFDAPAVLTTVSRLVIDCNRHQDAADLIPEVSDGTVVPGNLNLSESDRRARIDQWFRPYHDAVELVLRQREAQRGVPTILGLSIHSMRRLLFSGNAADPGKLHSQAIATAAWPIRYWQLCESQGDVVVGDNQPYRSRSGCGITVVPFHAMRPGMPHVQVEFRQDEIAG